MEKYFELYTEVEYIDMIHDHRIRGNICAEYDTDNKIISYSADNISAGYKRNHFDHIIVENIYYLKVEAFANERLKLSSFIQVKQTIAQIKISPSFGIMAWSKRFDTFQIYLPLRLWVVGAKRGEWPTVYQENCKREILEFALSATYLKELLDVGWCLSENTYSTFIDELNEIEPGIKLKIESQ